MCTYVCEQEHVRVCVSVSVCSARLWYNNYLRHYHIYLNNVKRRDAKQEAEAGWTPCRRHDVMFLTLAQTQHGFMAVGVRRPQCPSSQRSYMTF